MRTTQPVSIARTDYRPPNWLIDTTDLHVVLKPAATEVTSRLALRQVANGPLRLDGVGLELISVSVDGETMDAANYQVTDTTLELATLPEVCILSVVTRINPDSNKALEGLYLSSGNYCTQCEAEGFRKITYYPDRPDILSIFTVTLDAEQKTSPVLLANGNLQSTEVLADGWHRAVWHDPFPKPCYLFALVAGDLANIDDTFVTASGRDVALSIYVEAHNVHKCAFAMQSLKASMRWDEAVYGLEYDLDCFMIVAVDDFNMGAMENKGLNIFNSKYVLADDETATDQDFMGVESVIAHEYFHNWTGNRVTCRDWFQLSLKEGLTVFRDQEFTSDMRSREVKRIEDVRWLRARQFAEDRGPTAHPIRPDSYIEINNFYTLTVYEKGAEVIRMMHTLLGAQRFRQGIDTYFERHDGQAVTCDDFIRAMHDAGGVDLTQFSRWYEQAGTPMVEVTDEYDAAAQRYTLHVSQHTPDTPGQTDKLALHIPLRMGLLGATEELPLSTGRVAGSSTVLDVTDKVSAFVFEGIAEKPLPSLLRGFSAPVELHYDYSEADLARLMSHDSDAFNRWDAGQRLATLAIRRAYDASDPSSVSHAALVAAFGVLLGADNMDRALQAEAMVLPSIDTLIGVIQPADIQRLEQARHAVRQDLATGYQDQLLAMATAVLPAGADLLDGMAMANRRRRNVALELLTALPSSVWSAHVENHYWQADNMTDRLAALQLICHEAGATRDQLLDDFLARYQTHRLVVDKWFAAQALSRADDTVSRVSALSQHPLFDRENPNRLYALVGSFAAGNAPRFHDVSGAGFQLLRDEVARLDESNPQVAARLLQPLARWRAFAEPSASAMRASLESLKSPTLSPDVFEIVDKSLS